MITANDVRGNLMTEEQALDDFLVYVIEPKILEVSSKRTWTEFRIIDGKNGVYFESFLNGESWEEYSFNKVEITNKVIDVLKEKGYKVEVKVIAKRYGIKIGNLVVSWGEE